MNPAPIDPPITTSTEGMSMNAENGALPVAIEPRISPTARSQSDEAGDIHKSVEFLDTCDALLIVVSAIRLLGRISGDAVRHPARSVGAGIRCFAC